VIRVLFFIFLFPLRIVLIWDDAPKWAIWAGWGIGAGVVALMAAPNPAERVSGTS